jgi:hypothetical protein
MCSYRQLLIDAGQSITNIEKETRNASTRMDVSLGRLDGLELQVASIVGYSKSNLLKMDDLESQLTMGIQYSESNFGLVSLGIDKLGDSVAPMRTGLMN